MKYIFSISIKVPQVVRYPPEHNRRSASFQIARITKAKSAFSTPNLEHRQETWFSTSFDVPGSLSIHLPQGNNIVKAHNTRTRIVKGTVTAQ